MENPEPPSQTSAIPRELIIVLGMIAVLTCCIVVLGVGGFYAYQEFEQASAAGATATSAYMATKVKEDTDARATAQAQATATAQVIAAQATATAQVLAERATATAQARLADIFSAEYFESFDDNQTEWRAGEQENDFWLGNVFIDGGIYRWKVDEVKSPFVAWADSPALDEPVRDFDLAVTTMRYDGTLAGACSGLIFRKSPEGFNAGAYLFAVCDSGSFAISYYDVDTGWEKIQDWTETEAITSLSWNLLEVQARGENFTLFINHRQVATFTDSRLAEGYVSVFIDFYEADPGEIWFDDFSLQPR
jgi:hypothetical protein